MLISCHHHSSSNSKNRKATSFITINNHKNHPNKNVRQQRDASPQRVSNSPAAPAVYGSDTNQQQQNKPLLDTKKLLLVEQLLNQLQQAWLDIDSGINEAYALWDGLLSNDDQCAMLLSGGASVEFTMDMDDDDDTCFNHHRHRQQQQQHHSHQPMDYQLFCHQLTALIHIENSILNVIEHYQFCVEQYCRLNIPTITTTTTNTNTFHNRSVNNNHHHRQKSMEATNDSSTAAVIGSTRTSSNQDESECSDQHSSSSSSPVVSSIKKREPFSRQRALGDLQVNNHIDRICSCARVFGNLRRILVVDDTDLFCEFKALFFDVEAITGHSPKRAANSLTQNHVCMLEKTYNKFQRKVREYERLVVELSTS